MRSTERSERCKGILHSHRMMEKSERQKVQEKQGRTSRYIVLWTVSVLLRKVLDQAQGAVHAARQEVGEDQ